MFGSVLVKLRISISASRTFFLKPDHDILAVFALFLPYSSTDVSPYALAISQMRAEGVVSAVGDVWLWDAGRAFVWLISAVVMNWMTS